MDKTPFAEILWDDNGVPRSRLFDDQYFCQDNGYAEAIHVCCDGNRLQERFRALDPAASGIFTIMETGFGTGLDFCCAWQMWAAHAPKTWRLHFVSLELYPVPPEALTRALDLWPAIAPFQQALSRQYAPVPGARSDMLFDDGRVHLTIIFDDVVAALQTIRDQRIAPQGADAWFLDGFGPAKNPRMWSDEVFAAMAPFCRAGTTLSTFTVAGAVRRGLASIGFSLEKIPGHGRKNHILTGLFRS